jgi:phospholipid transport system substrate-binding protein
MKYLAALIGVIFFATVCTRAVSAHEDPSALVTNVSEQVRAILMKENGTNTTTVRTEVEQVLLPRFDFTRMTALAVGKFWKSASTEQKTALTFEFQTLLSNTYFNTMLRYRDVGIKIKPDVLIENEGKQATVKSEVAVTNAQKPVAIDYILYNTEEGWKVYNINVEGASLVTVYRNQFGEEINKNGIDGLVQSLHAKNEAAQKNQKTETVKNSNIKKG